MGASKIENYLRAVERLSQAVSEAGENPSDLIRDGVIQRFEFCSELAWKAMREYLIDQGFWQINSPKSVMKEAYAANIISDERKWIGILNDHNLTAHIYDEERAVEIFNRIRTDYLEAFQELKNFFKHAGDIIAEDTVSDDISE